tara:strand:- start:1486 stop:2091 length:606 start_codon:yes stop_codon:yes gene_type:complete
MKISYSPHIALTTGNPFVHTIESKHAVHFATALHSFQLFLGQENHSQSPHKSRIEFQGDEGKIRDGSRPGITQFNHYNLLEKFNDSQFLNQENPGYNDVFLEDEKCHLHIYYYPQVPGNPFVFPVESPEQAHALLNMLYAYDDYLLTKCDSMRVDYSNSGGLNMRDPVDSSEWINWDIETDDDYFDNLDDYMESKKESAVR